MADLNFPTNPNPGDLYTIGDITWQWDGYAWIKYDNPNKVIEALTATSIHITSTTNAISTDTGALIVDGGVGIAGDLWLGGTLYTNGLEVLTTASFGYALSPGVDIEIVQNPMGVYTFNNTSTLETVTSRGSTTPSALKINNTTDSTSTNTGALVVKGGLGVGEDVWAGGRVHAESVRILDSIFDSSVISINNTETTVIDVYSINDYRTAKYLIQIDEGTGTNARFYSSELMVVYDNQGNVWGAEYGIVPNNPVVPLGEYSFGLNAFDQTVTLEFTASEATNKTVTVLRLAMTV